MTRKDVPRLLAEYFAARAQSAGFSSAKAELDVTISQIKIDNR
jgi:hypothetical protein